MDIIASMLAYLVCMSGLVTGLIVSAVIFFSAPNQPSNQFADKADVPAGAIAMVASPSSRGPAKPVAARQFPVKTIAGSRQNEAPNRPVVADAAIGATTVAPDAQQQPPSSPKRMRRLAEKERAKHLAFRERSSFETRFLHYDD